MVTQKNNNDQLPFESPLSESKKEGNESIAIIGIGCRFPGAKGPRAYWELLRNQVDAITEIPPDRFDVNTCYDPRPGAPGKISARWGGFLDNVDRFDANFFGISPREASRMDPQQRLLLEVAWESLEDAGHPPAKLNGSCTGVFIGMCYNDYEDLEFKNRSGIDVYVNAGGARSAASGRLSYALGLEGPSVVIDTACSSSLVAVHLACQSLRDGETSLAIAGAVNLILQPESSIGFSNAKMLAPDGRCKVFDARANGFVRSEGVGVVVLKPLAQAMADGDPIWAVIRGSAVNNDGRSSGFLMTPGCEGQKAVIRKACHNAGISPGQIQYVEAHGTGTNVGDPIEVKALGEVLREGRPAGNSCWISSAKANIGHTEAAAGMAGMIKVALCLRNRMIPSIPHFQEPNPNVNWQDLPLTVPTELTEWLSPSAPRLAGVSAFGLSGTNAHVILEEGPCSSFHTCQEQSASKPHLLTLSAHQPEALAEMAKKYQTFLSREPAPSSLRDICYTASVKRDHHNHRLACVGRTAREMAENLGAYLTGELNCDVIAGNPVFGSQPKVAFVFSGHGSQYAGMGRSLYENEPVFRDALEVCDQAISKIAGWSVLEELYANEASSRLHEIDVVQPSLFAVQVALTQLWRSWGVAPDAVVGHSMGEVAAAHIAGALTLEDAASVICLRSRMMKRTSGHGAMALVEIPQEEALLAIAAYKDLLSIAANNSPASTVLSGEPTALETVLGMLESLGVFCRRVKIDVASHSPQMEPLLRELEQDLKELEPMPAAIPICSTVTGEFDNGMLFDAGYWRRNLREPVRFSTAIQRLYNNGCQFFVEISPHPVLTDSIQKSFRHMGKVGRAVASLRSEEDALASSLRALGELYTSGYSLNFAGLYPEGGKVIEAPLYAWRQDRHWFDAQQVDQEQNLAIAADGRNNLAGRHFHIASQPGTHLWQMEISLAESPDLRDHRVKGRVVLPAAAYLQIALAGAREIFGSHVQSLEQVSFHEALMATDNGVLTTQLVISPNRPGYASFKFYSLDARTTSSTLHASGIIVTAEEVVDYFVADNLIDQARTRCVDHRSETEHYEAMQNRGLEYGPAYRGVAELWRRDGEVIARIRYMEDSFEPRQISAPLLDACFQAFEAALPEESDSSAGTGCYLPVSLDSLRIYRMPSAELWSRGILRRQDQGDNDMLEGDVLVTDENGQPVMEAEGLRVRRLGTSALDGISPNLGEWFYEIQWHAKEESQPDRAETAGVKNESGAWLIFADNGGLGERLACRLEEQGEICSMIFHQGAEGAINFDPGKQKCYRVDPTDATTLKQIIGMTLAPGNPACKGVIHLWGMDLPIGAEFSLTAWESSQSLGCESVMYLTQALTEASVCQTPRLWLVSRGAQSVVSEVSVASPAQSTLWGLGRVITHEHPELHCTMVDLSPMSHPGELQELFREIMSDRGEDQIALRDGRCYAARMVPRSVESLEVDPPRTQFEEEAITDLAGGQYRLVTTSPGVLDNLTLCKGSRKPPARGDLEIEVMASGLNFIDVMKAMGVYPGQSYGELSLGIECSGRVTAVGEGVSEWQVGDEVMAIVSSLDAVSAFVNVPEPFVAAKPESMSFEEAATTPIAFLTAYYALLRQGRLASGERVLIHAAAGGVGLAAVQLCQHAGAEIYATAGSPEKRDFLRSLGVEHVFDSRSLSFAAEVMLQTNNEGVDIVLNSLAGDAIQTSLGLLREGGRFLEIGKQDIYQNTQLGLLPFRRNISFSAAHLDAALRQHPDLFGEMTRYFNSGSFRPLPVKTFPISEAAAAFRYMAQAKHIGKVALSLRDSNIRLARSVNRRGKIFADATYLITGGLGDLGLLAANWLVEKGARRLVLMGRTGASEKARHELERLRQAGAEITVVKCDVSHAERLAGVLAEIEQTMPPLKGVIHAAGALDDGVLRQLNADRFRSVMAPKLAGAWNLHELTSSADLDFFVLFSSVAALLGSPGQGNYAAGNAFMDGLVSYRQAQGAPALGVNWGPWAKVGMAARTDSGDRLALRGLEKITPEQGVAAMELMIGQGSGQFAVMPFDCALWQSFYPSAATSSLFACLSSQESKSQSCAAEAEACSVGTILAAPQGEREALMQTLLSRHFMKVLGLGETKNLKLNVRQPLNRLGMDSLMALEIKNLVEQSLDITIPISSLLSGSSLTDLAKLALDQLAGPQFASNHFLGVEEYTGLRPSMDADEIDGSTLEVETNYPPKASMINIPEWEDFVI
ncbi:MAG: type I polyketide synthase [Chloracidobacterium sp.]|nr:type I polyketide synthase [Chloracidobacterium sp.]